MNIQDELLWGASWLHWASEDVLYMSYIQSNGHTLGAEQDDFSFSWDDKRVGTKVLLSKVTQVLTFFFFFNLRKKVIWLGLRLISFIGFLKNPSVLQELFG